MTVEFTDEVEANRIAYSERFRLAVAVGKDWNILEKDQVLRFYESLAEFQQGRDVIISAYQVEQSLRPAIRKMQKESEWRPETIRSSSVHVHSMLSQSLWEQGTPNLLTIGDVQVNGADVWHPTLATLKAGLTQDIDNPGALEAHAWLTFPDQSIVDATWWFNEHRAALPKSFSWSDRVFFGEPVVGGRAYRPMVAGGQFALPTPDKLPWLKQ